MLMTVAVDEALYERAMSELPPGTAPAILVEEALRAFVLAKSAKRLAAASGTAPQMADVPRRQSAVDTGCTQ